MAAEDTKRGLANLSKLRQIADHPDPDRVTPTWPVAQPGSGDAGQRLLIERGLRWTEVFSAWSARQITELTRLARLRRHAPKALLSDPGRRELFVVVTGLVEVSTTSQEGRTYMHAFLAPGHVAPLVSLVEGTPIAYQYRAHIESQVVHLPAEGVMSILDAEPALWQDIARLALRRQSLSTRMLYEQAIGSLRRRLAATLADLARVTDRPLKDGESMAIALSQGELAAMLGVSRQTLNKALRQLAQEGVVEAVYKRITVRSVEKLQRIALGD